MSAGSGGETIRARDPFADDVLRRLVASNQDYQRAHGHYIVPLAERLLEARAALAAAEEATKEANAQEDEWMRQRDHFESAWQLQRERAISAEAERDRAQEALRCITSPRSGHLSRDALRGIARAALAAGGREPTLTEPEDPSRESPGATAGDLSPSRGRSPSGSVSAGGREPGQATAGGET